MAQHIDRAAVLQIPAEPYAQIRQRLASGDLLFCSGEYFVSWAIQRFTNSPWSHVGIIFRADSIDRVLLLESVEDMGVRFAPLSMYLSNYNGSSYRGAMVVARHRQVTPNLLRPIAAFGVDELTRPYDRDEIGKIVARIALNLPRSRQDREYICSELVHECFNQAGIQIAYNAQGYIAPEDVWIDPNVQLVGRFQ